MPHSNKDTHTKEGYLIKIEDLLNISVPLSWWRIRIGSAKKILNHLERGEVEKVESLIKKLKLENIEMPENLQKQKFTLEESQKYEDGAAAVMFLFSKLRAKDKAAKKNHALAAGGCLMSISRYIYGSIGLNPPTQTALIKHSPGTLQYINSAIESLNVVYRSLDPERREQFKGQYTKAANLLKVFRGHIEFRIRLEAKKIK